MLHNTTFEAALATSHLSTNREFWKLRALIECQSPHPNLYDFKGRMQLYQRGYEPAVFSLDTTNLLLRGARLRNTDYILGCAVYTGKDTKMALNSKLRSNKFSTVERSLNKFLAFYLIILLSEVTICTVLQYHVYGNNFLASMTYMGNETLTRDFKNIISDAFAYFIILCYIIPISMYVTIEMQKFMSSFFFGWDEDIMDPDTEEAAKCNSSDLNEELGQVQYLFTDKTGTLTENLMQFRQCSVGGSKYTDIDGKLYSAADGEANMLVTEISGPLETFLLTVALCHTVQATTSFVNPSSTTINTDALNSFSQDDFQKPLRQKTKVTYHAFSPDEKALVEACAKYGVVYKGITNNVMTIYLRGIPIYFRRLQVLEFDSDRKLMSVVVKDERDGSIWLLTKGAEVSVLSRCRTKDSHQEELMDVTLKHIDDFALLGLRTLAFGRRKLDSEEYALYAASLAWARQLLEGREERLKKITEKIESNLTLLGATGVEDLLQEGVQETLESLRAAGVKIWVLTGDKVETAVNVAYSCGHFKRFMTLLTLTQIHDRKTALSRLSKYETEVASGNNFGLVVDGTSLALILAEELGHQFYSICRHCTAVTCCRLSPKQKAEIVHLVKQTKDHPICAAIGDGANDVSMIQEANVGLGIMGKEGRHAVRCSDFAFSKFRFLRKVLLVHGHWYYIRVALLVQYSFYKNVIFITPQFFYSFWSACSTQNLYDGSFLTLYNLVFTSVPVIIYGLLEQNLPADVLLRRPHLYQTIAGNKHLSWALFLRWALVGLWHASAIFVGFMGILNTDTPGLHNGQTTDMTVFGTTIVATCIFVVSAKLLVESNYFNILFIGSIVLSLAWFISFCLLYSAVIVPFFDNYALLGTYYQLMRCPAILLGTVVIGIACLLPDILLKVMDNHRDNIVKERTISLMGLSCFPSKADTSEDLSTRGQFLPYTHQISTPSTISFINLQSPSPIRPTRWQALIGCLRASTKFKNVSWSNRRGSRYKSGGRSKVFLTRVVPLSEVLDTSVDS